MKSIKKRERKKMKNEKMNLREKIDYFHRDQKFHKRMKDHNSDYELNDHDRELFQIYNEEIKNRLDLLYDHNLSFYDNHIERMIDEIDNISDYFIRIDDDQLDQKELYEKFIYIIDIIDKFLYQYHSIHHDYHSSEFHERIDRNIIMIFEDYDIDLFIHNNYIEKLRDNIDFIINNLSYYLNNKFSYDDQKMIESLLFEIYLLLNIYF